MSEPVLEAAGPGHWSLSGDLDFHTLPHAWSLLKTLLDKEKKVVLSLQDVARVNSAGLGFLLEGLEYAQQSGCRLRFTGFPDALQDLAEVSGLTPLLDRVLV